MISPSTLNKRTPRLRPGASGVQVDRRAVIAARRVRVQAVAERYLAACRAAGRAEPEGVVVLLRALRAGGPGFDAGRLGNMVGGALRQWTPPAWRWENVLEATDCQCEERFVDFGPPPPCPFRAGSREKVEVLALRVERGEELWHRADGGEP